MSNRINSEKKRPPAGCFKSLVLGVGCLFVYLFVSTFILFGLSYVLFAFPYKMISQTTPLPEFRLPQDSDYSELQEKLIEAKENKKEFILLSVEEYNAYLNKLQTQISWCYYIQKVRFNIEQSKPVFYIIGSGFTKRELNIKLQNPSNYLSYEAIYWNKFQVPHSGLTKKISNFLLEKIINTGKENSIKAVIFDNFPVLENGMIKIRISE